MRIGVRGSIGGCTKHFPGVSLTGAFTATRESQYCTQESPQQQSDQTFISIRA